MARNVSGLIFPIVGYVPSLKDLPNISNIDISEYYRSKNDTENHYKKSFRFFVEEYIDKKSLVTFTDRKDNVYYVKGKCYRSQRARESPYTVVAALNLQEGMVLDSYCECIAGLGGTCNHLMALLRLLEFIKSEERNEHVSVADENTPVSKTSVKQTWNRKRGDKIHPLRLLDINFQSPKENRELKDMKCKIYESRKTTRDKDSLEDAVMKLGTVFNFFANTSQRNIDWKETTIGCAPKGSPLSYHLQMASGTGELLHNLAIYKPQLSNFQRGHVSQVHIPGHHLLNNLLANYFPLDEKESIVFEALQLSPEECVQMEIRTRLQSKSADWLEARKFRLTSSTFGQVCVSKRNGSWTEKGLKNLIFPPDIGHVRAVKYGIKMEPTARESYVNHMHDLGHNVEVRESGLIISPSRVWLGSSPDGIVYDPKEDPPFGLIEIKCAYTLKDLKPSDAVKEKSSYVSIVNGSPQLSQSHKYYYQVMGQLGLSGFTWCDFVVYFEKGIIIQRIQLDTQLWDRMLEKIDKFYFELMLPKLAQL